LPDNLIHCEHVGDGQIAVEIGNNFLYRQSKRVGMVRRSNCKRSRAFSSLIERKVDGLIRRSGHVLTYVANDTNDFIAAFTISKLCLNMLSNRVLTWKIYPYQRVADNNRSCVLITFIRLQKSSLKKWYLHCTDVAGIDDIGRRRVPRP